MRRRLVTFAVIAGVGWGGALAGFYAYVNWFSEAQRDGDTAILAFSWLAVLVALSATLAFAATAVFAVNDRVRGDA